MNKLWNNKKMCVAILALFILVLAGILIGVAMKGDKAEDTTGKVDKNQDIIIYDTDENTVEKKAEEGLKESDSEDGPVLSKDNMINFDGSDANDNKVNDNKVNDGNNDGVADEPTDENPKDKNEADSKDTGSFGRFY